MSSIKIPRRHQIVKHFWNLISSDPTRLLSNAGVVDLESPVQVAQVVWKHWPVPAQEVLPKMREILMEMTALVDVSDAQALKWVQVPTAWHVRGLPANFHSFLRFLFKRYLP
jgi:hypothetical protein